MWTTMADAMAAHAGLAAGPVTSDAAQEAAN
jgi:hypothetical protein